MTVVAGVVGNPKPASRTLGVAREAVAALGNALTARGLEVVDGGVVDLAELGGGLICGGSRVRTALATVTGGLALAEADLPDASPRIEDWIEVAALGIGRAFHGVPAATVEEP